jgi:uncharacterized protein
MRDALPHSVDPRRLAELNRAFTGRLPLGRLPRLAQVVTPADPAADYASYGLRFRRDESGRDLVEGEVSATLHLRCERCNQPLELPVASAFKLAVVEGLDEAAQLPDAYDPLLPEEATLDPAALVEDELLLAVPSVPRHAEGACHAPRYASADKPAEGEQAAAPADDNPFAVLESLKHHH